MKASFPAAKSLHYPANLNNGSCIWIADGQAMQKVDIKGKTGVTSLIHYALLEKDLFHSLCLPVLLLKPTSSHL
jgi:hypothetical protein